jgi:hypothetical protein
VILADIREATIPILPTPGAVNELSTRTAMRYVEPLREGGSLPAVVDTDGGLFVVKFRGAGQGPKALIAELVVGLLAEAAGLPVPELVLVEIPEPFGRSEPDPEIQDILRASHGVNVGLRYLDGAFNFALPATGHLVAPGLAAEVVWLDAFLTNPDRTHRNPNLLIWDRRPWLIDHGAALYAHHDWPRVDAARTRGPFPLIRDHVLLAVAGDLEAADATLTGRLGGGAIEAVLRRVPDALLVGPGGGSEFPSAEAARDRYATYLTERLRPPRAFAVEATAARERVRAEPPRRLGSRR